MVVSHQCRSVRSNLVLHRWRHLPLSCHFKVVRLKTSVFMTIFFNVELQTDKEQKQNVTRAFTVKVHICLGLFLFSSLNRFVTYRVFQCLFLEVKETSMDQRPPQNKNLTSFYIHRTLNTNIGKNSYVKTS